MWLAGLAMIRGDIRDLPCLVDAMQDVRPTA
jgi:hypothetical protein